MKILVTGGAGFIGSHTCVELLNAGYNIVLLDNFSNSYVDIIRRIKKITGKNFPVYTTDVLFENGLQELFKKESIDAVIHFAALKAVGESVKLPLEYYTNNINGMLNLLKVMCEFNCHRFVFSSSATVYGSENPVPYVETQPIGMATNPYGTTKIMSERILNDIALSPTEYQWNIALLRYFNPVGGHSSGLLGDNPNGIPNNLMPYVVKVAKGELQQLNVFGGDYDTPDGTAIRDYIHVVDLALGHIKALDFIFNPGDSSSIEAFNLGTGRGNSVLELINTFERINSVKVPYIITDRRDGDLPECYADTSKAERILNWKTERLIDEMCRDAWKFNTQF
jgi:UDP-glucose 4-epimerase